MPHAGAGAGAAPAPAAPLAALLAADGEAALAADVAALVARLGGAPVWVFGYGSLVWRHDDVDALEAVDAALGGARRRLFHLSPDHRGTPARPGRVATLVAARAARRWAAAALPAGARDAPAARALGARALALWIAGDGDSDGAGVGADAGDTADDAADDAADAVDAADDADDANDADGAPAEWPVVHGVALRLAPASAAASLARLCGRERAGYRARLARVALAPGGDAAAIVFAAAPRGALFARAPARDIAAAVAGAAGASGANVDYLVRLAAAMRARGVDDAHAEAVLAALPADARARAEEALAGAPDGRV